MDGGDVSDVSHVSDSLSASSGGSESYISDLSDNAAEFNGALEEEDGELYPPEEDAYRANNWIEACRWMNSEQMMGRIAYNLEPYYHPFLNLGKDTEGKWRISEWDGGWWEYCDKISDIYELRPREGCTRDQIRVEYVKGWVSHLKNVNHPWWVQTFKLYDGSIPINVTLTDDTASHEGSLEVTSDLLREGCVVILYHVAVFVDMEAPPGTPSHHVSAGYSNILGFFG